MTGLNLEGQNHNHLVSLFTFSSNPTNAVNFQYSLTELLNCPHKDGWLTNFEMLGLFDRLILENHRSFGLRFIIVMKC